MSITREGWGNFALVCLLLTLLLLPGTSFAQSGKGFISGSVVDNSGAVLSGALVELLPIELVSVTNGQGVFTLPEVPAGKYTVAVSYVGFRPKRQEIEISSGQMLNLELKLDVTSNTEEIIVTSERPHGEAEAINQTRTADNILQVLPAEVITSLPNANVADAIGRLPSVSLYRIEGEGVYIQVRGTEPRLTNVTVDGITIPSPEPTVRQVRLDVLPSDLVEAVELNKTLSANQDADGIGGSVNLRTKEAGEQPTFNFFGNGGYTNIENGRASYGAGGTVGKRFGATRRLGLLGNVAYDYNGRGIDNIQPSLDPRSTFAQPFYDNDTVREYRYYRHRYGFAGSADYRLTDNASVYARGLYSDFKDWGDKWYYSPVSTAISSNGALPSLTAASPSPKFYTSSKRPNASVGAIILGGREAAANSLITWELSAARSY